VCPLRNGFKSHDTEEYEAAISAADAILEEIEQSLVGD